METSPTNTVSWNPVSRSVVHSHVLFPVMGVDVVPAS
jgi:hypothetical protein